MPTQEELAAEQSQGNLPGFINSNPSLTENANGDLVDSTGKVIGNNLVGQVNDTSKPVPVSSTPLVSAAAAITPPPSQDLSGTYGLNNGTVYNKQTGQAFSTPQDFFKESGVKSFQGVQFDNNYNPNQVNNALNAGQNAALDAAKNSPETSTSAIQTLANTFLDKYNTENTQDSAALAGATTGANSIAERTKAMYGALGIDTPDFKTLNNNVGQALKEYNDIQAKSASNLSDNEGIANREGSMATTRSEDALNTQQQVALSLQKFAASTKLQVAQQQLNSATDMFKTLADKSEQEQANEISTLSTKLGLDKTDLSTGVAFQQQAMTETHDNAMQAKQLIVAFATNNPDVFGLLTPQDQIDLKNGNVTPSILTKIGQVANVHNQALEIQQQNANNAQLRTEAYLAKIAAGNDTTAAKRDAADTLSGAVKFWTDKKYFRGDGTIAPNDYRKGKAQFISNFATDFPNPGQVFDNYMAPYIDRSHKGYQDDYGIGT